MFLKVRAALSATITTANRHLQKPYRPGSRTIASADAGFSFASALHAAIEAELSEPYESPLPSPSPLSPVPDWALDGNSPFSSPSPLSPVPDHIMGATEYYALDPDLLPPPMLSHPAAASTSHQQGGDEPPPPVSNAERRKRRGREKRAAARQLRSHAAGRGSYDVRPKTANRYVRPAEGLDVMLDAEDLPHTKNGYTGGNSRKGSGKAYGARELLCKHGMRLVRWDGRYAFPIHASALR